MNNMTKCYIASYPLVNGELQENIILQDTWFSPAIRDELDRLVAQRKPGEPMIQCWYSNEYQVDCLATTDQPFTQKGSQ